MACLRTIGMYRPSAVPSTYSKAFLASAFIFIVQRTRANLSRYLIRDYHLPLRDTQTDPRSRGGLVDEDISSDNNDYDRILNAYYDRSPLELLESSVAIAEAEDFMLFAEWDSNGKGLAGLKCDDTTRLPFRPDGVSVDGARFLSVCPGGGLMESPYEL
ncbi:uncharacterized protein N7487_004360 [Penicillium crustosum]|uniref:uncharacterized protein n=1 Tax=Penicillium crustosum TaxID=36656 RepID=UPI0023838753|nr:uncharacterized protein N7487_004360 [Penicillium crustosum]KAJ5410001.1 hypothetical protein N7487_004360 [Penicillium crustosum]